MLPMFMAMIDQTIVASALPAIGAEFGRVEQIAWVVVYYLIATAISAPVSGRLGDALGRRKMLVVALFVSVLGGICCALATSLEMLVAARVLQGLGGGGLMALSQALIGQSVAPRERAKYQGYIASVAMSASMMGPVVGGFLTEYAGWRWVFLLNLPLGLVAAWLVLRLPPRSGPRTPLQFDWIGLGLFSLFVWSLLAGLGQMKQPSAEGLRLALLLGALSLISVCVLLWHEKRASSPLLPLPSLRNPSIWRSDVLTMCHGAVVVSLITFIPIYLRAVRGASAAEIGLLMLPLTIGIGIGSMITGQFVSRTGWTMFAPSVALPVVTALLVLLAFLAPAMDTLTVSLVLGLTSICLGTVMGSVHVTVLSEAGSKVLGAVSGMIQLSRSLGAAVGTTLTAIGLFTAVAALEPGMIGRLNAIMQNTDMAVEALGGGQGAVQARHILSNAFTYVFLVIAAFSAGGALLAWSVPRRKI